MRRVGINEAAGALTLVDDVYQRIHNAIIVGELKPGQQIKQIPLADGLGVSQRTVREALMRIAAEGLIQHEPRKGFRVSSFPFHELEEIYQIRCLLEGFAVEKAAEHITQDELAVMHELLERTADIDASRPISETHDANQAFHITAIRASRMPHLIRLLEQLWKLMFTQYGGEEDAVDRAEVGQRELHEHRELLHALEQGNGSTAKKVLEKHIIATVANLKNHWGKHA